MIQLLFLQVLIQMLNVKLTKVHVLWQEQEDVNQELRVHHISQVSNVNLTQAEENASGIQQIRIVLI